MLASKASIVGKVEYREGDGAMITIPLGPCEVSLTNDSATISWTDGNTRGLTAIPLSDYQRYVNSGAIVPADKPA